MQKLFNLPNQSLVGHRGGRQTKRGSRGGQDYLMSINCCETPTATPVCSLAKESARSHCHLLGTDDVPGFFLLVWTECDVLFTVLFLQPRGGGEGVRDPRRAQTPRGARGVGDGQSKGSNTILTKVIVWMWGKAFPQGFAVLHPEVGQWLSHRDRTSFPLGMGSRVWLPNF